MDSRGPDLRAAPAPAALETTRPTAVLIAVVVLSAVLAAVGTRVGMPAGTIGGAATAGLVTGLSVLLGYVMGRRHGAYPGRIHQLMIRIAEELAQYRAFTRLLRDQGTRITETTGDAARMIVTGLCDMDAKVALVVARIEADLPGPAGDPLQRMAVAIGDAVVDMVGQVQFQDITRQQLAFLSRLSHVVDAHMIDLAGQLGDPRSLDRGGDLWSLDRVAKFKGMFAQALADCVMTSQRDDHHVASGLDRKEPVAPKIELF
ncbi:MAG: hypothetical protein P4M00_00185 [Azospirillaceae bacterium]|nr:hypothetical protein [Azospirillaceae bacterium]